MLGEIGVNRRAIHGVATRWISAIRPIDEPILQIDFEIDRLCVAAIKKAKTLSESLAILGKFKLNGQIDPDLFDVFIWEKVYLKYAQQYLDPELIDNVDFSKIPGYVPPPSSDIC